MGEEHLIQLTLSGDRSAFQTLVESHQSAIHHYIQKLIQNPQDAQDLCQRVFMKCFTGLRNLREPEKFTSWLYTIARNKVYDYNRRNTTKHVSMDTADFRESELVMENELGANPAVVLDARMKAALIRRAVDALPDKQSEVIILKIYHNLKFIEIAEIMDLSINTVKSRLYYGLSTLKDRFKQWDLEDYVV